MTCGIISAAQYCLQTTGYRKECAYCDANDPALSHNPEYLTDVEEDDEKMTHWQSVTMNQGVHELHGPEDNQKEGVNLTMNLMKSFDITYVRLKFSSPRPETFAIYKKNRREPWKPVLFSSDPVPLILCSGS